MQGRLPVSRVCFVDQFRFWKCVLAEQQAHAASAKRDSSITSSCLSDGSMPRTIRLVQLSHIGIPKMSCCVQVRKASLPAGEVWLSSRSRTSSSMSLYRCQRSILSAANTSRKLTLLTVRKHLDLLGR